MDLGFQGVMEPKLVEELCTACGDCIKICPTDAFISSRVGWLARVGGKHGKHPYFAYEVAKFLTDEQVYSLIEKTLEWYRENGAGRERIGVAIERLGLKRYIDEVVVPLGIEPIKDPRERDKYFSRGNHYAH
ncbi:4Fe-4S binding protein [candidate division KSB1 bacterium]